MYKLFFFRKKQASILAPKRVYISVETDLCGDLDLLYFKQKMQRKLVNC